MLGYGPIAVQNNGLVYQNLPLEAAYQRFSPVKQVIGYRFGIPFNPPAPQYHYAQQLAPRHNLTPPRQPIIPNIQIMNPNQVSFTSRMNQSHHYPNSQSSQFVQNVIGSPRQQFQYSPQRMSVGSQPVRYSPGKLLQNSYIRIQQPLMVSPNLQTPTKSTQQYGQLIQNSIVQPIQTNFAHPPIQINFAQPMQTQFTQSVQPNFAQSIQPNYYNSKLQNLSLVRNRQQVINLVAQPQYQQNIHFPTQNIKQIPRQTYSPQPNLLRQQNYLPTLSNQQQLLQRNQTQYFNPNQFYQQQLSQQQYQQKQQQLILQQQRLQVLHQQQQQQQQNQQQYQQQYLLQQQQSPPQQQQKKDNITISSQKKQTQNDDLDQRFNEALIRTKKIVEKFTDQDKITQSRLKEENQANQNQEQIGDQIQDLKQDQSNEVQQEEEEPELQQGVRKQSSSVDDPDEIELEKIALQYEDGYIYRGQGVPPQTRQGFGVLTDADGNDVYSGFWDQNFYSGEGRLNNLNQIEIVGKQDWSDLNTLGNGWCSYEGEFQKGKMHGRGNLLLTNNEKFYGSFKDGMVDGKGQFVDLDENVINGVWENGIFLQLTS